VPSPNSANLGALEARSVCQEMVDAIVILGTIDLTMGEVGCKQNS
jgi:NADH:ubiquinone oxidoreductase subunit D